MILNLQTAAVCSCALLSSSSTHDQGLMYVLFVSAVLFNVFVTWLVSPQEIVSPHGVLTIVRSDHNVSPGFHLIFIIDVVFPNESYCRLSTVLSLNLVLQDFFTLSFCSLSTTLSSLCRIHVLIHYFRKTISDLAKVFGKPTCTLCNTAHLLCRSFHCLIWADTWWSLEFHADYKQWGIHSTMCSIRRLETN